MIADETRKTILVIEDEKALRQSIAYYLEDRDFRVLTAENGRIGLEMYQREHPHLVLTDLRMPEMNGLEVLRRASELSPEIPLIVVSGTGCISETIRALQFGAWDYILKPIEDMSIIIYSINKALERARLLLENREYQKNLERMVARRTLELKQANINLLSINQRLRKVVESTRNLATCNNIACFCPLLLKEFANHMQASGGSIYLVEKKGLRLLHTLDPGHAVEYIHLPLSNNSIFGRAINGNKTILIEDIAEEPYIESSGWDGYSNNSLLAFPFSNEDGKIYCILTLHSKKNPPFIEQDREIGAILASYCCETYRAVCAIDTLRASEERFRDLAEMLPEAVFETDRNLKLTFANRHAFELFGYSEEDLSRGINGLQLFTQEDRYRAKENIAILLNGQMTGTVEYLALKKDGLNFPALFHANSIMKNGELYGYRGIIIDITERKLTEKALLESEERFRAMSSSAQDAIIMLEPGGDVSYWNDAAQNIFGWSNDEIIGKNLQEVIRAEYYYPDNKKSFVTFQQVGEGSANGKIIELTVNRKDGTAFPVELSLASVKLKGKRNTIGIIRDVTERKRAEEELAVQHEELLSIFDSFDEVVYVADPKTYELLFINRSAKQNFGGCIGEKCYKVLQNKDEPCSFCSNEKILKNNLGKTYIWEFKNEVNDRWYRCIDRAIKWPDSRLVRCEMAIDITENKRLTEMQSRAERLEMAGTIAGQVAHDFNNLLAPIMAYPELIHNQLSHDHKAHVYLNAIEIAAEKIANINQDLLTMGRRGHYNQGILDLNRIVLQAIQEIREIQEIESQTKTVKFDLKLCKNLMKIKGGNAQIHRVLTNLLTNAIDAMEDIGQITISTENYYIDNGAEFVGCVPRGEYVKLIISDNGCGIPDNIIRKILDPFFSTKTADKKRGSGLGLSVVDAVVKDHNGFLDLSSEVGYGTSFYLYFPISREDAVEEELEHLTGGTEKILVVDDDDIQREVSLQLLMKLGYRLSSVQSGEEAVEFIRANPQDLIILDMVMPGGIDGTETLNQIIKIRPQQKTIIYSGFSESNRVLEAQKLGAGAFVKKPVTKNVIAAAVRTELDRKVEISISQ